MTDHDRRTFLRGVGAASLGVLAAGCSGDGSGDTDEPTDTPTDSPTATRAPTASSTATATATETAIETGTPTETSTDTAGEADHTAGPGTNALHDPRDGFATMGHWLEDESDDVEIRRITEDDLSERNFIQKVIGSTPRVVVFETSGRVHLENRDLVVGNDKCWIAGQTAPAPGITITGGKLSIEADDCVVQHLRIKPGDGSPSNPDSLDAIFTQDGTENNVIDHCTATWSMDEALTVGYDTNDTTVTNCLIGEPLNDSLHSKGPHGYGSLTGDRAKNVFYAGNVWLQCIERNPLMKNGTETAVVNNLMHYFGDGTWVDNDTRQSVVGNVFERPQTDQPHVFGRGGGRVYGEDNQGEGDNPTYGDPITMLDERPLWPEGFEAAPSDQVREAALTHAGTHPANRTDHDRGMIRKIRDRSAEDWVDSQSEVGGYPDIEENTHELDVPDDVRGELRAWLREHARRVEPDQ